MFRIPQRRCGITFGEAGLLSRGALHLELAYSRRREVKVKFDIHHEVNKVTQEAVARCPRNSSTQRHLLAVLDRLLDIFT
jgi:hypothetical protein